MTPEDYIQVQSSINILSKLVDANHLMLKYMMVSRKQAPLDLPNLQLNGVELEQVKKFKYLHAWVFSYHLRYILLEFHILVRHCDEGT